MQQPFTRAARDSSSCAEIRYRSHFHRRTSTRQSWSIYLRIRSDRTHARFICLDPYELSTHIGSIWKIMSNSRTPILNSSAIVSAKNSQVEPSWMECCPICISSLDQLKKRFLRQDGHTGRTGISFKFELVLNFMYTHATDKPVSEMSNAGLSNSVRFELKRLPQQHFN